MPHASAGVGQNFSPQIGESKILATKWRPSDGTLPTPGNSQFPGGTTALRTCLAASRVGAKGPKKVDMCMWRWHYIMKDCSGSAIPRSSSQAAGTRAVETKKPFMGQARNTMRRRGAAVAPNTRSTWYMIQKNQQANPRFPPPYTL